MTNNFKHIFIKNKIEILFAIILLVSALIGLKEILFTHQKVLVDDPEIWYALYHYFQESFFNNTIPLWNPYMNGGEPFWPVFGMIRLLNPINFVLIGINIIFQPSIFFMYHIYFILTTIPALIGTYFLIRYLAFKKNPSFRDLSFFILLFLLFSKITFGYFLNDANQTSYYLLPFLFLFLIRFLENKSIYDYLLFIYCLGQHIGSASYQFVIGAFLIFVFTILAMFKKKMISEIIFFVNKNYLTIIVSTLLLIVMILPMISTFFESKELYPIARTSLERNLFEKLYIQIDNIPYDEIMKGDGRYLSLEQIISVFKEFSSINNIDTDRLNWINFFLFSFFNLLILIGFILSKNKWKYNFIVIFIIALFITLGMNTPIHKILCIIFPPLILIRHPSVFVYFLVLLYIYFIIIGYTTFIEYLDMELYQIKKKFTFGISTSFIIIIVINLIDLVSGNPIFKSTQNKEKYIPDFPHFAEKFRYIEKRNFAMPRTGWYLLEPILYKQNVALQMLAAPPVNIKPENLDYYKEWNKLNTVPNRSGAVYGLRTIFWTRNYHRIYLMGESNIEVFNTLMGINQNIIDFKENNLQMHIDEVQELITTIGGANFKKLLQNVVIINSAEKSILDKDTIFKLMEEKNSDLKFSYNIEFYNPDNIKIEVNTNKNGMLLFRDGYHKDWRAYVNGDEVPLHIVNMGFKGINIKSGIHKVEFKYRPSLFLFSFYSFFIISFVYPIGIWIHFIKIKKWSEPIKLEKTIS